MDEIFSSTNPIEGVAAAYSVAKALARHPQTTVMVSTHFHHLGRLASDPTVGRRGFVNLQMPVRLARTGAAGEPVASVITYPYLLRRGVSRQYVAIELLAARGFDQSIVEDALAVKAELVRQERPKSTATRSKPGKRKSEARRA
jgi:DNA mismatch repair ATPase MutS